MGVITPGALADLKAKLDTYASAVHVGAAAGRASGTVDATVWSQWLPYFSDVHNFCIADTPIIRNATDYDRVREYTKQTNAWRDRFAKMGAVMPPAMDVPPALVDPPNPLTLQSSIFGDIAMVVGVAAGAWIVFQVPWGRVFGGKGRRR